MNQGLRGEPALCTGDKARSAPAAPGSVHSSAGCCAQASSPLSTYFASEYLTLGARSRLADAMAAKPSRQFYCLSSHRCSLR